ncbi:MAG: cation:proton antiporter [Candidatus Sericytochromatia bacterium]
MMEENLFTLPVTEPVSFFALMLGIILLVPLLFERMRLPGLVGLLVAGVVIGPNGLHIVNRSNSIILLATIGLLYVMFIAGLEIDLGQLKRYRHRSLFLGVLSFAIPQVLGTLAGLSFGFGWMGALLLGSVLASHTLLAYPIISRLGLGKRLSVTTAVGGTILTDMLALLVLAIVAGGAHGDLNVWFWVKLVASLSVYTVGVVWLVPRLARAFFKNVGTQPEREYVFVLGVMFAAAFLARVAGIEAIIGAFLAGLTLNRFLPEHSPLLQRVQFVGNAIFIPFFLLATGMLVDPQVFMGDSSAWVMAGVMTGIVVIGKLGSSWLTGAWFGYSTAERLTMFGLTVPQAAATLAATLTGHKLGLFSMATVNGVILMILVTCIIGPAVVQRYGRQMAADRLAEPERVDEMPERILVPFANPDTAEHLMDLAIAIRSPGSGEPVFPLMVVRPDATNTQAQLAGAEQQLAHATLHLAGAAVPVVPLTRVGLNVASVVCQAALDTRCSTVILGWNGERTIKDRLFGSVIDQVLASESSATLVAHLAAPLVTASEVALLVPPLSERHPGFLSAIKLAKRLAEHLGIRLAVWTIGEAAPELMATLEGLGSPVKLTHVPLATWGDAVKHLRAHKDTHSLVVFLSAREGDLSWEPSLAKLPQLLADGSNRNFLVLYPPELAGAAAQGQGLAEGLEPVHEVVRLEASSLNAAIAALYAKAVEQAADGLPATMPAPHWVEVINGAAVASMHLASRHEMKVMLGVHQGGMHEDGHAEPIRVVLLCLMPEAMPLAQQAAYLRWISAQVAEASIIEHLQRLPDDHALGDFLRPTRTAPLG